MAKKRKLPPKSAATASAAAPPTEAEPQPEAQSEPEPQQEEQPTDQVQQSQEHQEEEIKQEEIQQEDPNTVDQETQDLEIEIKGEEEDEAQETKQENDQTAPTEEEAANDDEDDEEEPVQKLLEPFTKDQLIDILARAADAHSDVLEQIRKFSDTDPVHRKIFVHGLGWDTNADTLNQVFGKYGEIEDMNAVSDKITGKSKGYAFILYKSRSGARKALKEPQKKIGTRMTACQLASAGPVPANAHVQSQPLKAAVSAALNVNVSEYTQRKIYVSNVAESIDPQKLVAFFSKFGEIEEGPLGLDKATGKPKGFALFVYKSIESARKALEEPHKPFEGHILHCQKAIDGPKPNKANYSQYQQQSVGGGRPSKLARTDKGSLGGSHLMAQSGGSGVHYNQGGSQGLNPVLGQALTAMLASQGGGVGVGGGLGLTNLLGNPLGNANVNLTAPPMMNNAIQGGYGNQFGTGYGSQSGMQGGYSHSPMGQGSGGRSQRGGYMGGVNPYTGH